MFYFHRLVVDVFWSKPSAVKQTSATCTPPQGHGQRTRSSDGPPGARTREPAKQAISRAAGLATQQPLTHPPIHKFTRPSHQLSLIALPLLVVLVLFWLSFLFLLNQPPICPPAQFTSFLSGSSCFSCGSPSFPVFVLVLVTEEEEEEEKEEEESFFISSP